MAERFARAHGELTSIAERCSDAEWRAWCGAEGWQVGTVVYHVAADYPALLEVLQAITRGGPSPSVTREQLDQRNAEHARLSAQLTRGEILTLLRRSGEAVSDFIRRLDAQQFDRTGRVLGQDVSGAQVVESWMIGHIQSHVSSIRAAIAWNGI
jgi:hypothetical protein